MPLYPCKEPLNQPSAVIEAKLSAILRFEFATIPSVRSDHVNAIFFEFFIQFSARASRT
jgi:hypothetical protein